MAKKSDKELAEELGIEESEFDVDELEDDLDDLGDIDDAYEEVKKVAAPKKKKAKEIDPEDDRENWPTIRIEMEDDKPNYEFLASHGTKKNGTSFGHELQIMRGIEVKVPPSIVHMLNDAVATHHISRRDPQTGKAFLDRQDRSSVPWRLIKPGKYIR